MSKLTQARTFQETEGFFVKQFADKPSYLAELNALRELSGTGVTPEILEYNDSKRILRIADAGITLRSLRVDLDHSFSMQQVRRLASGLCECLATLHAANFCHYDVKEDNICIQGEVREDGSYDLDQDFKVKLIDFGLSFRIDDIPQHYFTNTKLGTPVCRSPEHIQALPQFGKAADVFCAAATIVQIIDGSSEAFPLSLGNPARQILTAQERVELKQDMISTSGEIVPKDLQMALFAMLHPDPNDRPRSETCYYLLAT